ncbi:hypothetical protein B2J93_3491 [Marssonina coronariae]|uniref:Uncharacterized protein n=1 Tax=Diplocarpon coronariae TaxID=2795749 RepID=A0A218Z489_9HELO|nr:hypothetical protein B2J93_3491 [Marssonina coronariae]
MAVLATWRMEQVSSFEPAVPARSKINRTAKEAESPESDATSGGYDCRRSQSISSSAARPPCMSPSQPHLARASSPSLNSTSALGDVWPSPTLLSPMALSAPLRLPTPRIVITEPGGEPLSAPPPWRRRYLAAIWLSQLLWLMLGMAVLPYESAGLSLSSCFLTLAGLGNVVLASTPAVEAHRYAVGTLTPAFFLRAQRCKAAWALASLVVVVVSQGAMPHPSGWSVFGTVTIDVLYAFPFAFGYQYARLIEQHVSAEAPDHESLLSVG